MHISCKIQYRWAIYKDVFTLIDSKLTPVQQTFGCMGVSWLKNGGGQLRSKEKRGFQEYPQWQESTACEC